MTDAEKQALHHLGNVLYMLSDLHPDDRCDALDEALNFYNAQCPDMRVEPSGMAYQRLINTALGE